MVQVRAWLVFQINAFKESYKIMTLLGKIFSFTIAIIFVGGFVGVNVRKPFFHDKTKTLNKRKQHQPRIRDTYLISSELSYGRLSNLKISISEIIGLSLILNRTAVLPKLESCIVKSEENKLSGSADFDQLFDTSSFSHASVVSSSGLDLNRACGQDAVTVVVSNNIGGDVVRKTIENEKSISLDSFDLSEPFIFGSDRSSEIEFKSYPYDKYFLPHFTFQWLMMHNKDRLLPDKLVALNRHRCIVIGKNFLAINWARLPKQFEEVHRELRPSLLIREDVGDFLQRNGLIASTLSHDSILPFLAVHLRMGDFLEIESYRGFGFFCNKNPDLIIVSVRNVLNRLSNAIPIVLATDDYQSICAIRLRNVFPVIILDGASRFYSKSCQGAIFDQEVLGASSYFIGDKMSTFSQSIHQIRTIRHQHNVDTTTFV